MKVNGVNSPGYVVSVQKTALNKISTEDSSSSPQRDKLVLSNEAKQINKLKSGLTEDRMALIKQRIAENFYDQDEILKVVAERMMNSDVLKNRDNLTGS